MYDAGKIVLGLAVFVGVSAFPIWYNIAAGKGAYAVQLEPPPNGTKQCVAETANGYMRAEHMHILDERRNMVVRDGKRPKVTVDGVHYDYSLSKTCMNCHSNKEKFCDSCHTPAGVAPACWDCHVAPEDK